MLNIGIELKCFKYVNLLIFNIVINDKLMTNALKDKATAQRLKQNDYFK